MGEIIKGPWKERPPELDEHKEVRKQLGHMIDALEAMMATDDLVKEAGLMQIRISTVISKANFIKDWAIKNE